MWLAGFYRHIGSIIGDDLGAVRQLACPFGCATPLTDGEIRKCFRKQHQPYWLFDTFRWMLYSLVSLVVSSHSVWWNIRLTLNEKRDLERYLAWSLQRGLADLSKKQDDTIILQCPGLDCQFQWIVADPRHRRAKQRHEMKPYILWYAPYRVAENAPSNFLHGPNLGDIRRMQCPACRTLFCGLCRNPWMYGLANHSYRACRDYAHQLPANRGTLADRFALATVARFCPGCARPTQRIDGCNHISCPCGTHWCYACGARWGTPHYYCSDALSGEPSSCAIL